MEKNVASYVIEWYRVRLAGDPVLSEARNPGTKNNKMRLFTDGDGNYIIQDIYPDDRFTVVEFNKDHVMEFIYKVAGEDDGQ